MASQCPIILVKDFNYTNNFALIIKFIPNSYQVLNDEPVVYSEKDMIPQITINNEPVDNLTGYPNINELKDQYNNIATELKNNINDKIYNIFSFLDDELDSEPSCPTPEEAQNDENNEKIDINIYDSQGNLVKEILDSLPKNPTTKCDKSDEISLVNFFELPDSFDPLEYQQSDPVINICNLPDSALKKQVDYVINNIPDDIENLNKDIHVDVINEDLQNLFPNLTGVDVKSEDDLKNYYDNLKKENLNKIKDFNKIIAKLGIPLCTLNESDPVILQLLNKKIQVMNLYSGNSGKMLEIDKEIDLNIPLTVIFKTNGFLHELYLMIEGDPTIYYNKVFTPKNLSIYYIGVDPKATKNYCGLILDIQILTYINDPVNTYLDNNYLFKIPQGCLAFYDWHKDRIDRNLVYPLPDKRFPVKMYGDNGTRYKIHTEKNPYHFMEMSYLSEFFCSKLLNQDEWSFWFWFYIDKDMPYYNDTGFNDYRTLIYDFINKNSLEYDFGTKTFKINFGDSIFYKNYMFSLNTWYFIVFKYKKSENLITLQIRRIDIEDPSAQTIFNSIIEKEFTFNLTSMLASFDGWRYDQFFACKFGTLAIFDRFTTESEEINNFSQNKLIIKQLDL